MQLITVFDALCTLSLITAYLFYVTILSVKQVFHTNLRLLLLYITLVDIALPITRFLSSNILPPSFIMQITTSICYNLIYLSPFALSIERLMAMRWPEVYERNAFPIIALSAISIQVSVGFSLELTDDFVIEIPFVVEGILKIGFLVFSIAILIILPHVSNRMHGRTIEKRFSGFDYSRTMHSRYHSNEVYRSLSVLKVFLPFYVALVSLQFSAYLAVSISGSSEANQIFKKCGTIIVTVRQLGSMFIVSWRHPALRKFLRIIVCCCCCCKLHSDQTLVHPVQDTVAAKESSTGGRTTKPIYNVQGEQLAFSAMQEVDLHFAKLKTAWG